MEGMNTIDVDMITPKIALMKLKQPKATILLNVKGFSFESAACKFSETIVALLPQKPLVNLTKLQSIQINELEDDWIGSEDSNIFSINMDKASYTPSIESTHKLRSYHRLKSNL